MDDRDQRRFIKEVELLKRFGTELGMPHARPVRGKIWELRYTFNKRCFRVFYFVPERDLFILLHLTIKKTNRTETRDIETAGCRMKQFLEVEMIPTPEDLLNEDMEDYVVVV
jgi:phage-related protein